MVYLLKIMCLNIINMCVIDICTELYKADVLFRIVTMGRLYRLLYPIDMVIRWKG